MNSSVVAPTTIASAPRHVTAVDKKGVITVRWTAPASNGGAAITKYSVVSLPAAKTCTTTSTSCTFKGLNKKLHYSFEVRATNKDGLEPALGEVQLGPGEVKRPTAALLRRGRW